MFAEAHSPERLDAAELDYYLEQGWFRMGQTIFTTNFLNFKNHYYSAIWLRINLDEFVPDAADKKLGKINSRFRSEIAPAVFSPEKEILFEKYKDGVSFEPSPSVQHLMFGKENHNVFNTYEICLYDDDKLIACGFFDLGATSAAGITSFYDPDYKKFSLGKYLIYSKIRYSKQAGMRFFYPGYFVPGYKAFDYKLSIGKSALQYLQLSSGKWFPIQQFTESQIPLDVMNEKLLALRVLFLQSKINTTLYKYQFFDASLIPELRGAVMFDYPLFLTYAHGREENEKNVIVFNVCDTQYHVYRCAGVWATNTDDADGFFSSYVLVIQKELFSSRDGKEILNHCASSFSSPSVI